MSTTAFEPVHVPSGKPVSTEVRYNVRPSQGELRISIYIPAEVYRRVKPTPKGWRLDVNKPARRARLSALIQIDGAGCKKHKERDDEKSLTINYRYALGLPELFPENNGTMTELPNVAVTSMGIEFDLPPLAKSKAKTP